MSLQEYSQQVSYDDYQSNQHASIICTNGIVNGEPRLSNRLISVRDIVSAVQNCERIQEVVEEYHVTFVQIKQALQYCSSQHCKQDMPSEFCRTCSLQREQKGPLDITQFEEVIFNKTTYVRGNNSLFLGTIDELLVDWNGKDWWEVATDCMIDHRKELFT